jgi:MscS family membrane protein
MSSIENFINHIKTAWEDGVMGMEIQSPIIILTIIGGFFLVRGLITALIIERFKRFSDSTENELDDSLVEALTPPIRFIPVILAILVARHSLDLADNTIVFISQINRSLTAFVLFWALYRGAAPLSIGLSHFQRMFSSVMQLWMVKAFKILVIFLGGSVVLELWGIAVAPLLAGLGLFGAAIALGAQDLFKNLIGGITIIAEKRYHTGDWIKVDCVVEGTVEHIGFRSTTVRRFDKALVYVPNASFSDSAVTNFSKMTHRRIKWHVGVTYDTSVDQLKIIRDAIEKYILDNEDFASPDEVSTFVRVDHFGDSAIVFLIYCFTKTTQWGEWLAIKEDFACAIKDIVEDQAGSGFAFPSTSLYVESMPNELMKLVGSSTSNNTSNSASLNQGEIKP